MTKSEMLRRAADSLRPGLASNEEGWWNVEIGAPYGLPEAIEIDTYVLRSMPISGSAMPRIWPPSITNHDRQCVRFDLCELMALMLEDGAL